jgi:pilus assembly protein CpaF
MVGLAGIDIPPWAVRKLVASSIHLIVQLARMPGGRRKVVAVSEVTGMEGEVLTMHELFEFVQTGVDNNGVAQGHFRATGLRPSCLPKLNARGAGVPVQLFAERVLRR